MHARRSVRAHPTWPRPSPVRAVTAAVLLVVLIVPTAIWFAVRGRQRKAAAPKAPRSEARRRWWMP